MGRESRLLIVDDNATTRYAMRRVLERHGYQVLEAGTGSDGLALVAGAMPDALILDVNLPDMSGFDIARQSEAYEVLAGWGLPVTSHAKEIGRAHV